MDGARINEELMPVRKGLFHPGSLSLPIDHTTRLLVSSSPFRYHVFWWRGYYVRVHGATYSDSCNRCPACHLTPLSYSLHCSPILPPSLIPFTRWPKRKWDKALVSRKLAIRRTVCCFRERCVLQEVRRGSPSRRGDVLSLWFHVRGLCCPIVR